jgi:hypothetical protein
VNAGITRRGKHDFGHPWHHLVDRIQIRIQEIYDVVVFPSHENASQFKAIKDFVAVGIGPLSHSFDYVTKGMPHPSLKGDFRFLAKKMKVVYAPMPVSHPMEKAMFNHYKESHPNDLTKSKAHELAKTFKRKTNGTTILPKLPSMLFQYEKAWKRTNEIKMAREEMKESFKEIIGALTHEKAKESAAWGAMMDDNDDLNITPKTDAIAVEATATDTQIHVAPICGPTQTSYIPTSTTTASSQQTRACYYAPYCKKEASICGGWKKGACNDFKAKVFMIPDDFLEEKEELKKLAKRRREKERAERNKKSKQNRD